MKGRRSRNKISTAVISVALLAGCTDGGDAASTAEHYSDGEVSASWHDPVPASPPPANMPAPGTPEFIAAAAADYEYSQGRGLDQQANPDYNEKVAPLVADYIVQSQGAQLSIDHPVFHDPYIEAWGSTVGQIQDVEFLNRYGAKLTARFYAPKVPYTDPVTGKSSSGPFPTIVFIPGFSPSSPDSPNDHLSFYEGMLEHIAAHGYVVLGVNPQGQGGSEQFAPPNPYCDANGSWKQPQELGLVEQGACAGQEPAPPAYSGDFAGFYNPLSADVPIAGDAAAFLLQNHVDTEASFGDTQQFYIGFRPRFVFPALDAAGWLTSTLDPWRALIDESRIGIVGHSAGADAAIVAGNGDPLHRFKVAVAWDGYGLPPDTMSAAVPSLFIHTELQPSLGPYTDSPHDEYFPAYRMAQRFRADGVDSMLVALRGSNHPEFGYIPYQLLNPITLGPFNNASSKGGAVSTYYTVAWFDRWLKGSGGVTASGDAGVQARDAQRRLLARFFDDSTDKTAIGQGTFDAATQQNVPYHIAGENIADHLTFFLHSQVAFDGKTCLDWQAGCPF